jgi:ketosteroid isomerase-like protein
MTNQASAAVAEPKTFTGKETVAETQTTANEWAKEIARLHRTGAPRPSAEDRLDIIELTHLFENAYDALDLEAWLDTWEDDGVFNSSGFGNVAGHQQLKDYFENFVRTFTDKRHVLSNHVIIGEGDTAYMLSYLTVVERKTGTNILGTSPFYDRIKKTGGRWRFTRRDQVLDPGMYETEVGKSLLNQYGGE